MPTDWHLPETCFLTFLICCRSFCYHVNIFGVYREDSWWNAAVECVDCIPKSADILDNSLGEHSDLTQKLRLYQSIADYYVVIDKPMWSENFVDIHVGLLNLLMQGRRDQVFKGLCLAVILLPNDIQKELKRLLRFLHQAILDGAVSLSSTVSVFCQTLFVFVLCSI